MALRADIVRSQLTPSDDAAPGLTSVAQLGGVDRNKYTGSIDWIPLTAYTMWQSPSQVRTVRDPGGRVVTADFTIPVITFDTGDPGALAPPHDDWQVLVGAVGGFTDSVNWYFPCGCTLTLNFGGSQGADYVIELTDPNLPWQYEATFCQTIANDQGVGATNWSVSRELGPLPHNLNRC